LNRSGLEKLCRYVCRPAVAAHRVEETLDGKIWITLGLLPRPLLHLKLIAACVTN
jgi:hypothetical protein